MWATIKHWIKKAWAVQPEVGLAFGHQAWSLVYRDANQALHTILIPKQDAQATALKKIIEQRGLDKKSSVCLLEPNQYQTFLLEKPKVPEQEMISALRWRVAELVDYPVHSAQLDYIELPTKLGLESRKMIYTIVAKIDAVNETLALAVEAGLKPTVLEIPEVALNRYLNTQQASIMCKVLVVFYGDFTHLIISKNTHILLMRRLDCSCRELVRHPEVLASSLALDIQRSLDYCSSHFSDASHAQVFLEGANLPNAFFSELSSILGLPVSSFAQRQSLGIDYTNNDAPFLHYAALGALSKEGAQ